MMEFAGEFEVHLTVGLGEPTGIDALRDWAARRRLKCVHIILDRGQTASQPMLTLHGRGSLSGQLATASQLGSDLGADGFIVLRVKIEAAPTNEDVPRSDVQAADHPAALHFEHHLKLLLGPTADLDHLALVAGRHAAHVSRNALRVRDDGRRERFVTQRCYGVGRQTADGVLEALRADLVRAGYEVLEFEQEYVVHDSNAGVDAGWMEN